MADAYAYPLLVELEENKIPRLKNKLVKYFQSKKSNGGDCEVDYENGSEAAVLRFRKEEDRNNVLSKEKHQVPLEKGCVLNVKVRLPTGEKTAEEAPPQKIQKKSDVAVTKKEPSAEVQTEAEDDNKADEDLCSTSAVIGNIPNTLNQEFLEMLVENISKDASFTLELLPDISSAVVTFQSGNENTDFISRCPQNRMFMQKKLSVRPLEDTAQIIVEDIQTFSEDFIQLYFEKEGGDVEAVEHNDVEQTAVVIFKDPQAARKILKKKEHQIKQVSKDVIRVYPFYQSLGVALYGKDKPSLKLPAAISEPIDVNIWKYLTGHQSAAKTIHNELAKHYCNVNLKQSTVQLIPVVSLLQEKDAKTIIKEWKESVKSAFAQAVSKFRSLKFHPEPQIWTEAEKMIRQALLNEDVVLVADKASGVLSVVGHANDVNRLEKTLSEVINKIVKRVQRENLLVTQETNMKQSVFHILREDGIQDKLLCIHPELKISFEQSRGVLKVTGLNDEISIANKVIVEAVLALKRQKLEIDNFVIDLLKDDKEEELTGALLTSYGKNAAFDMSSSKVQLIAVSDEDLKDAEDHLGQLLMSNYIDVEDRNVLEMQEWDNLVSQIQSANSKPCRRTQIHITGQQVVVSGHRDSVMKVSRELEEFLTDNAQVEEMVVVQPNAIVEYIKDLSTSWLREMEEKIVVSYSQETIHLNGSRVDVAVCKALAEDLVSSLICDTLKVSKPGAKKFFQNNETMYVSTLKTKTGCLVQLVDDTVVQQDFSVLTQAQKPVYQLQTPDGVEIAVCKADMCSYPVDAVVNPSNKDLQHNGGLAAALLNAAGRQLQDDCDKIISSRGQLKPGDAVITDAGGQLCCKKVIHAVGPSFDQAKGQKVTAQLKRAVKESLDVADGHGCVSVAVPAISRNQGFPLDLCAVTIVKAVREHCDEKSDDGTLKKIHLVNNDDSAVQAIEAAVRKQFGNHGVSHSQQPTAARSPILKPPGSSSCLYDVQTKEGLGISLTKGNIEAATTDVTVNTVFEDLSLNKGAISTAILRAAGQKLQQLVNAKKTNGTIGEVIVTDGCKLKSKQVFHAIAPHWDNGAGPAEQTLRTIFNSCLEKAESTGLTSISFPAIGTGNLCFPKDLVATLILDEILKFSSAKQLNHLKNVVIILYPGDAKTIQVFSDVFSKTFPSASGGLMSSSSQQNAAPFSNVVSGSGMHETKMGSVTIQVVTGDITKETTDVIVNSSNEQFTLRTGVSKAILDAAGQAVETESKNLGAEPNSGMIMTQPGNLKCRRILHLVGQTDPVKVNKVVKDALLMCLTHSHTSVSFPAIGTGQGNVQAKQVADAMLDAVIEVLSQNTSSNLTTIRIVIFQPPMLKDFYNSMQERGSSDAKEKGGFWTNLGSRLKSLFVSDTTDKPQKGGDFVTKPLKVDPACFHICGDAQANVDSAKQWITDLISREQDKNIFQEAAILSLSDADYQCIVDIQKKLGVSIGIESKLANPTITIEGITKDVLKASKDIEKLLRKTRELEEMKKKVELTGTMAEWQYQSHGLQFQSFDAMANFQLEEALDNNKKTVIVTVQGQDYTIPMPSGPGVDSQGRVLKIRRIDKLRGEDLPECWETMPPNKLYHVVPLQAKSSEYDEVLNLFQATCNRTVTKIERIQNPTLWKSVQLKKLEMDQKNGHQNNEKRLFHGTAQETLHNINAKGFNRSYAGKNAACYGNGTYFAINASYSAGDTYSKPNANGEKLMYLCKVLTGDFALGQQNMLVPPAKGTDDMYDSVVDKVVNPTMFIIFHDTQAYPEYLITFK
ncbi:poly(ADP-ribose) polymerase family member 14-related sequence 1 [Parambassis ranga]|uniref:Poly [ADP-ribose] polymerase n=1 Tax=Parambassis ranga TaxID=210632 RepID=A0A6P7KMA2_9TELE|nr:protein mono-ADP-ribosyltransferase PARP14-like [Parambassis ranga]